MAQLFLHSYSLFFPSKTFGTRRHWISNWLLYFRARTALFTLLQVEEGLSHSKASILPQRKMAYSLDTTGRVSSLCQWALGLFTSSSTMHLAALYTVFISKSKKICFDSLHTSHQIQDSLKVTRLYSSSNEALISSLKHIMRGSSNWHHTFSIELWPRVKDSFTRMRPANSDCLRNM